MLIESSKSELSPFERPIRPEILSNKGFICHDKKTYTHIAFTFFGFKIKQKSLCGASA